MGASIGSYAGSPRGFPFWQATDISEFLDGDDPESLVEGSRFEVEDQHFGVGQVNVRVSDIGAPEEGSEPRPAR